ncbi:MAG TPA: uroporphyrinogen decarboxylase family protein [Chloroflexota bacterium]|nr:uroporphyrinogen decarboxylase family protein [Chloroflexota bacterium]
MADTMTPRERLQATIRGESTNRPAWSLWRHFYATEATPEGLAESMLGFQNAYQFDFMKVNPRASYHVEDWGVAIRYSGDPHRGPSIVEVPVKSAADWRKIEPLPADQGVLGDHLKALRLIRDGLHGRIPFIMTVFNPLSLAGDLVQSDRALIDHLREAPDLVHQGLAAITETYVNYTRAILELGASGLFFATTSWASRDALTVEQYRTFGRPYDLKVLDAAKSAEFNLLHVCGDNDMLFDLADYPVHAVNWASTSPSNPSIAAAAARLKPALVAGISREALTAETADQALVEARRAREESGGKHWALGPVCSIPTRSRPETIQALRDLITMGGKRWS